MHETTRHSRGLSLASRTFASASLGGALLALATGFATTSIVTVADSLRAPAAAQTARANAPQPHRVVGVAPGDVLFLRTEPDAEAPVVAAIPPTAEAVLPTGRRARVRSTLWVEVRHRGLRGWVAARFLAAIDPPRPVSASVQAGGWSVDVKADDRETAPPAVVAGRVALLIANSRYPIGSGLPQIGWAAADVRALAARLGERGWQVTTLLDGDLVELRRSLAGFARRSADVEESLLVFVGHGLSMGADSYLIPIGSRIRRPEDVAPHAVSVRETLASLASNGRRRAHVLLDAAHDHRLVDRLIDVARATPAAAGKPSSLPTHGLVPPQELPAGVTLMLAAEPGPMVRPPDPARSSLVAVLTEMKLADGRDVATAMTDVRDEFARRSSGRQVPWLSRPHLSAETESAGSEATLSSRPALGPGTRR